MVYNLFEGRHQEVSEVQDKERSQKQHENFWDEMIMHKILKFCRKKHLAVFFFICAKTSNGNNLFLYTSLPPKHQNKLCSIKN